MSFRQSPRTSSASVRRPGARRHSSYNHNNDNGNSNSNSKNYGDSTTSLDTLVNHVLAAKRSLSSSMTLVLRADELITEARLSHENTVVLAAQSAFLRNFVADQIRLLVQIRKALRRTYDWGKQDLKMLLRTMDDVDGELSGMMDLLRETSVDKALGYKGDERKNLLDFIDVGTVTATRECLKKCIQELRAIQYSFDGDLLRLDNDIKGLDKILSNALGPPVTQAIGQQMMQLYGQSTSMADSLASLTRHFDYCCTAVRSIEGAAALARRKAAEFTRSQGGSAESVSISGVITESESDPPDLEPQTPEDRAVMMQIVAEDAQLVDGVVREIQDHLSEVEFQYSELGDLARQSREAWLCMLDAYASLGDVEARLDNYIAAEEDFRTRWALEKEVIFKKLEDMQELRIFYDRYASAYGGVLLEVERRRTVEAKIQAVWRKAQESVDKILKADLASRDLFRGEIGGYIPGDLWPGMLMAAKRWELREGDEEEEQASDSTHTLDARGQGQSQGHGHGQGQSAGEAASSSAAGNRYDSADDPRPIASAARVFKPSTRTSQATARRKFSHSLLKRLGE